MTTNVLILYFLLINLVTFLMMGVDKRRARHRERRIPERTLMMLGTFGGALGVLIGMKVFRHKTRHNRFRYGMPGLLLGQLALVLYIGMKTV